ncbi:MAG: putative phosphoglycerate mutase [Parcubacteria group bacterium Gr01-1014_56]|nr:MAG: putative phosphoglycerate mutase [Parcubacteria group bacterium Gr01-1014_56]
MKKVYFVRHGITEGNEKDAYQLPTMPLSESGRAQANFLAKRFETIPLDIIISSDMARAAETAKIVSDGTGHVLVLEPLFHEILRPSVVRGKIRTLPEVLEVMNIVHTYWSEKEKKHSDEENFFDLKERATKALEYIKSRQEENILVVTHGHFLRMLLAVMLFEELLNPELFAAIEKFFYPSNAGITMCEYDNPYHKNKWRLFTWSDYAHLGDAYVTY